jgi:hypothetical protein
MVVIEDERHAEWQGEFESLHDAIAELRLRETIPWDQSPNVAPCTNWRNCGRSYEIIEYDDLSKPWKELRRIAALDISATGVFWSDDFQASELGIIRQAT